MNAKTLTRKVVPLLIAAWALPAGADTTDARCEMYREGDHVAKQSGPCQFSQRQGHVTIRLAGGKEFELSPASERQHYLDQHGKSVKLRATDANSSTYKWSDKRVVVNWDANSSQVRNERSDYRDNSNVPPSLKDMVGDSARHFDSELERRGYRQRQSWIDGDTKYSAWEEQENGNCVAVAVSGGRIITINNTERSECRQ